MDMQKRLTPSLCRAARGLLGISQVDLAVLSRRGHRTIKSFEAGEMVGPDSVAAIEQALAERGIVLVFDRARPVGVAARALAEDTPENGQDTTDSPASLECAAHSLRPPEGLKDYLALLEQVPAGSPSPEANLLERCGSLLSDPNPAVSERFVRRILMSEDDRDRVRRRDEAVSARHDRLRSGPAQ